MAQIEMKNSFFLILLEKLILVCGLFVRPPVREMGDCDAIYFSSLFSIYLW